MIAGCEKSKVTDGDRERVFHVRGVIRGAYDPAERAISIQHEEIPGYMPAMTMPFFVSSEDVTGLKPGDRVAFEFRVGETSRATNFRKMGREHYSAVSEAPTQTSARRIREGDKIPSFVLIDQDGRQYGSGQMLGHYSILTFIFTRCPVPEFCPLLAKKFLTLQSELAGMPASAMAEPQLLSITIDPEHDRPDVLKQYGAALGADFGRWRFLTGSTAEIQDLTRGFAVRTERNGGSIDHTLATVLVLPTGEVAQIWRGNAWKPEEIRSELERRVGRAGSLPARR